MKRNAFMCAFLLIAFLGAIFALNCFFHFCSDDCTYGLMGNALNDGIPSRIDTIWNALLETIRDGYRPVPHFFVRIFTGCFDKWVFNVCNTVMIGALILLVNRLATGSFKFCWQRLILIITLVFCVLCRGESFTWCAGSCNYLWMGTFTLGFIFMQERLLLKRVNGWVLPFAMLFALIVGGGQESFALPLGLALALYYIPQIKKFKWTDYVIFIAFGIGGILLILRSSDRASTVSFSAIKCVMNVVQIAIAVKAVWILGFIVLFNKERIAILKENRFFFYIILGSVLLNCVAGYNGERALWAANLAAIIVIVKLYTPTKFIGIILIGVMSIVLAECLMLGSKISHSFDVFEETYMNSNDGVACHERINCGIFSRFFYQCVYQWEFGGGKVTPEKRKTMHSCSFAYYHGRDIIPLALGGKLYNGLYLTNKFISPENRIPIDGEFYTAKDVNAIVMPIVDSWAVPEKVYVKYAERVGIVAKIQHEVIKRAYPIVLSKDCPVVLSTPHGRYVLIAKQQGAEDLIQSVYFE